MKQFFIVLLVLGSLLSVPVSASNRIVDINDRSIFNYELLDVRMEGKHLYLKGWGLLRENQNLHGPNTHKMSVEILSNGKRQLIPTKPLSLSLTKDHNFIGFPACHDADRNRKNCNYTYNNVGFEATIDISSLPPDATYEINLVIETYQTNKVYRTPLYYAQEKYIESHLNGNKVFLNASFETMTFDVYEPHLRVTSTPHHSSTGNQMRSGGSCSPSHGNLLYYKQGTRFDKPKGKTMYNDLISYYTVTFQVRNCEGSRRRVVEGPGLTSYIPSTFINYKGKPLTVSIVRLPRPVLSAEDHHVNQYDVYDPLKYASALDKEQGNITSLIKVTKNTVNTRIPGNYDTCYTVSNQYNYSDSKCVKVTMIPIKTRIRYINEKSFPKANLQLWGIESFRSFLLTILGD